MGITEHSWPLPQKQRQAGGGLNCKAISQEDGAYYQIAFIINRKLQEILFIRKAFSKNLTKFAF
jgi:hypothetical protein